ncbi:unnamed protein product [Phytophthora lilii]|uniref:Unnamed protein product n=1 Tax=Phytophthora lilii TaxID=2077276 RepID=A0A9W6XAX2_9STRA|nr:unnamed protein product [Phytophthora lilii]
MENSQLSVGVEVQQNASQQESSDQLELEREVESVEGLSKAELIPSTSDATAVSTGLHAACQLGWFDAARALIGGGADVDVVMRMAQRR